MTKNILEVHHLKQYFPVSRQEVVKAIDDVSFNIEQGETFGLVGESGSGKTTIGRAIIRLHDPTEGKVIFQETTISGKLNKKKSRNVTFRYANDFSRSNVLIEST
jgi:oligopeptide transport system ATP-binding protein